MDTVAIRNQVMERLSTLPMFTELTPDDRAAIFEKVEVLHFDKGSTVIARGHSRRGMYLLVDGRLKLALTSVDGRELALGYVEAPAHFAESLLAEEGSTLTDIVAVTDSDVAVIDGADLEEAFRSQPRMALSLLAGLSRRLHSTINRLEDMAFLDATHRVMRVVLNVATAGLETHGEPIIQGLTHYDIATLAGTSRETASRVISMLAREGAVVTEGRKIHVDLDELVTLLERS